jgi:hypothetical protein
MSAFIAERTSVSVRIYKDTGTAYEPRLIATMRRPDHGSVDDLLRAHRWHRVGPWAKSDDMPDGHAVAVIESSEEDR